MEAVLPNLYQWTHFDRRKVFTVILPSPACYIQSVFVGSLFACLVHTHKSCQWFHLEAAVMPQETNMDKHVNIHVTTLDLKYSETSLFQMFYEEGNVTNIC